MKKSDHIKESFETSKTACLLMWIRIWLHVLSGIFTLTFQFPFASRASKDIKVQNWSKSLLDIFNIELQVHGSDLLINSPHLIASNHISWLDIHVINAYKPIRFVAKSEVERWPIFGWMAKQLGTVFIRRDSARHARQVVDQLALVLKTDSICIFPEGTSTSGESVLPFKPNLFESALTSQAAVYPLAIRYFVKKTGERSDAPAFIGDMGLLESMSNIIKTSALVAQITILPPYPVAQMQNIDRKGLASYCQESISKAI